MSLKRITCQGGPCHRKLDRAPFLEGNCGVCDHACLQIGSLFAWALPREGWNERSCEEKSRGYCWYEASRSWDEEGEGIKRVEIVSYGNCVGLWCGTATVGQNHTIAHDNNTTFASERATFYLESLVLSFKSPTTWVVTNGSARSIQSNISPTCSMALS